MISRNHAEIEAYDSAMLVRDLGSSNGTYVDSTRIGKSFVRIGQRVCFGRCAFLVLETPVQNGDMIDSNAATDNSDGDSGNHNGNGSGDILSGAQHIPELVGTSPNEFETSLLGAGLGHACFSFVK